MLINNREAMEAHLTLQDWVPVSYGSAGARQGTHVVYVYRKPKSMNPAELHVGTATLHPSQPKLHDVGDDWFWSDELFWALVRALHEDEETRP